MSRRHSLCLILALGLAFIFGKPASAGEPIPSMGWRGDGSGRFAARPPQTWSKTASVAWKTELPGRGYSSPVFHNGRLFITAEPTLILCVDAATGEILWRQSADYETALGPEKAAEIKATQTRLEDEKRTLQKRYEAARKSDPAAAETEELKQQVAAADEKKDAYERQFPNEKRGGAGNAAGTPICAGKRLFVAFGSGVVAALELDGKLLWSRHVEGPRDGFGHSASPVLADGKVIVHYQNLVALAAEDGKEVWRQPLSAKFGTSAVVTIDGEPVLISPAGAIVRAADGRILAERQFELSNNSPVLHEGVLVTHGSGKVQAFQLPKSLTSPFKLELLWEANGTREQRMASAVCHDGLVYAVTRNGQLEVTDLKLGTLAYRRRLEIGEVFSSLVVADNRLYICGNEGKPPVLRPGREYEELAVNEADRIHSSPLCVGTQLFVRSERSLICWGRTAK